jgi:hypothetical protein
MIRVNAAMIAAARRAVNDCRSNSRVVRETFAGAASASLSVP